MPETYAEFMTSHSDTRSLEQVQGDLYDETLPDLSEGSGATLWDGNNHVDMGDAVSQVMSPALANMLLDAMVKHDGESEAMRQFREKLAEEIADHYAFGVWENIS